MDFVVLRAAFLCLYCGAEEDRPEIFAEKYVICRACQWLTDVTRPRSEADKLRAELWNQWESNHFEHCRRDPYHEGDCYWPVPQVLRPY